MKATLDLANLPDDPTKLKELVRDMAEQLHRLQEQLRLAVKARFGRKSETVDPGQMALFQKLIDAQVGRMSEVAAKLEAAPTGAPGHGRRQQPLNLPKVREHFALPETQKTCPDCKKPLKKIGEESRNILEHVPSSVFVRVQTCEKWGCPCCQDKVVTSQLPEQPISRCLAGEGMLAHVVVSKYVDHLPLYRQTSILKRQGLDVNRSTLCGWTAQVAELLEPLHGAMKSELLKSKIIHGDDTPVSVLDRPDGPRPRESREVKRRARQARLWVWVGDKDHPHTVFDYTPNRKREGPLDFLEGWKGYLQADAYPGYETLYRKRGVVEVACWAHARRKFFDAQVTDRDRAQTALAFIQRLYQVESLAKDLSPRLRQRRRERDAMPVLKGFRNWMDAQALVLPKSAMGLAIQYSLRQWAALCRYVHNGDLAIDNNAAENALRGVAVGRKNWLFEGSDAGGRRAAVLYTLVASCRRHGIDPYAYFKDVISRLGGHPAKRLKDLMPANWEAGKPAE
jgi:transposase